MKRLRSYFHAVCFCAILLTPTLGAATIIIEPGLVGGSGDVENVLLTGGPNNVDTGLTIIGETNQTHELVEFTSNETIFFPAMGQARIEAGDGFFDNLKINLQDANLGFGKIQFNIDSSFDGTANLVFTDQFGTEFGGGFALDGSGQNFFTAYSNDNQVIVMAEITSTVAMQAITDVQQVRLGPTNVVPEPSTMAISSLFLLGAGFYVRRKLHRKA